MEKNKKDLRFVLLFVAMIIIAVAVIFTIQQLFLNSDVLDEPTTFYYTEVDGSKINNSPKLNEVKTLEDGLMIQVTSLMEQENYTIIRGTIINETNEEKGGYNIQHTLLDKDGNTIITVDGIIPVVEAGSKGDFVSSIIGDYVNVYSIETKKRDN